ncbi:MAG: nucleotidyl transferase AbiEii/AbiGii toxin family protein [Campylobacterales bacterium]|nr:nucleotidyl transferase AbiEii/AbiGii toxin family protein [Campylobacterales bacterium]
MSKPIHPAIAKMLEKYDLSSAEKTYEALREILQEIVLLGLARGGFFDHALFYGGTALRILHGLDRFSEDLDFSLIKADPDFDLVKYEDIVVETLQSFGFDVQIELKENKGAIRSAFLKGNTEQHLLNIEAPEDIVQKFGQGKLVKIKLEVDTHPPLDFNSEKKTLLTPSPFIVHSMTLPSLFAGKMHAILCRSWVSRPKGRDWYDLVWYISHGYELDLKHLTARLRQSCDWQKKQQLSLPETIDQVYLLEILKKRIEDLDINAAKRDVEVFISDRRVLDIWSKEFFTDLIEKIKLF